MQPVYDESIIFICLLFQHNGCIQAFFKALALLGENLSEMTNQRRRGILNNMSLHLVLPGCLPQGLGSRYINNCSEGQHSQLVIESLVVVRSATLIRHVVS